MGGGIGHSSSHNYNSGMGNGYGGPPMMSPSGHGQHAHHSSSSGSSVSMNSSSMSSGGSNSSNSNNNNSSNSKSSTKSLEEKILDIINDIYKRMYASDFREPVDVIAHELSDYYDIVKTPMDLTTLKV